MLDEKVLEQICTLSQLQLTDEEKKSASADLEKMRLFMDKLKEVDTADGEALSHVISTRNVFREDVVTGGDNSEATLQNAPLSKEGMFVVPRTVG